MKKSQYLIITKKKKFFPFQLNLKLFLSKNISNSFVLKSELKITNQIREKLFFHLLQTKMKNAEMKY